MKLFSLRLRLALAPVLLVLSAAVILSGCGRKSRPASSLSDKDKTTLAKYEEMRAALAVDDLRTAKRSAKSLATYLKPTPEAPATPLDDTVSEIADAAMLDKARTAFLDISNKLAPTAEGVEGFYVMEAPVPKGAIWIQTASKVENPYVGKPMRDTGNIRK